MDKEIKSLKVVTCPYFPISNDASSTKTSGLFVVIYSEEDDAECIIPQNVIALKITSSRPYIGKHIRVGAQTTLTYNGEESHFKFNRESYILCSHFTVLPINQCIVLGVLDKELSAKIISMVSSFNSDIINQCCQQIIKNKDLNLSCNKLYSNSSKVIRGNNENQF